MADDSRSFRYVVLGAGRQGTAAAYDLARFGDATQIVVADADPDVAQKSAARINDLTGRPVATACPLDVTDHGALVDVMAGAAAVMSAVPYYYNLDITHAALEAGCNLCDLGGNTEVVKAQHQLDPQAAEAGVSIVPDCGMGPGLINTLGELAIDLLDEPREIILYDGGLPQEPQPPWNYQLTFHINGLTNEYDGKGIYLRDGKITEVDTLGEVEMVDIPALGTLEAFTSAGGLSTSPYLYEGQLQRYENKILRYPGHCVWFNGYKTLGLFSLEPVRVGEVEVVPRDVFHALLEPKITAPVIKDICVMRVRGVGKKDGKEATLYIDLVDRYDEETGFTSMERLTGWHCAIMMGFQARGVVHPGAHPMQKAVPAATFMEEVRRRGIDFSVSWE